LKVSQEERIYDKLLKQSDALRKFTSRRRVEDRCDVCRNDKTRRPKKANIDTSEDEALCGEDVEASVEDVRELQERYRSQEWMGIRRALHSSNRLSGALVRDNITCIINRRAAGIKDGFEQHTDLPGTSDRYLNLVSVRPREYDDISKNDVQRAFVYSSEEMAKTLCDNYLDNVEAYCNKESSKDAITEEEIEPDEKLMRSIEGRSRQENGRIRSPGDSDTDLGHARKGKPSSTSRTSA